MYEPSHLLEANTCYITDKPKPLRAYQLIIAVCKPCQQCKNGLKHLIAVRLENKSETACDEVLSTGL
jgi:hypothetical protein